MRIVLHTWLLKDRCLPKYRHTALLQSLPSARYRVSTSINKAPWDAPSWWHRMGLYWLLRIAFCCHSGDRHTKQAPVKSVQFFPFSKLSLAMQWSSFTQRVSDGTHTGENFQMCPSIWKWGIRAHLGSLLTTLWQGGPQFLCAFVKGVTLSPAKFPLHYCVVDVWLYMTLLYMSFLKHFWVCWTEQTLTRCFLHPVEDSSVVWKLLISSYPLLYVSHSREYAKQFSFMDQCPHSPS